MRTAQAANIRHEGRINSSSYGVLVHTGAAADVANTGPITSRFTGISARSDAEGVTVNQIGDITSTDGTAIVARSGAAILS